jgi:hypothetical protein
METPFGTNNGDFGTGLSKRISQTKTRSSARAEIVNSDTHDPPRSKLKVYRRAHQPKKSILYVKYYPVFGFIRNLSLLSEA